MGEGINPEILMEDLYDVVEKHSGLHINFIDGFPDSLSGRFDVTVDNYCLGVFSVIIKIPKRYPFEFPAIYETDFRIPRINDRHMYPDGKCCLDFDFNLRILAKKGISIFNAIEVKAIPFFADQVFFEKHNHFNGREYSHNFKLAMKEYFVNKFESDNEVLIKTGLRFLTDRNKSKDSICFCGSRKKFSDCHKLKIGDLSLLDAGILEFAQSIY